jgi:hypothetical protein
MKRRIAALLGAAALLFAVSGVALAATPASDDGITPVFHSGQIQDPGTGSDHDKADCSTDDFVDLSATGSATTGNGVTVDVTVNGTTNAVSFTATGGLVTIAYIKGSDAYNVYDYTGQTDGGVASDGNLFAPDAGNSGSAAQLSHAIFCTGPGTESTPTPAPTTEPTPSGGVGGDTNQPTQPPTDSLLGSSGPTDTAWLLVVGLGVLLASVVVLTPARAKNRR